MASGQKQRIRLIAGIPTFFLFLLPFVIGIGCGARVGGKVRTGAEVLLEQKLGMLEGKRVGLVTNHTGRLSGGEMLVDTLLSRGINVVALFAPEHGILGRAKAGEEVQDEEDSLTGIRIYSLHGKVRKPTAGMLAGVDLLLYDIQDIGVRFYTYISTMGLCMEASAELGIPFVVLDRPNPLGGMTTDGPVLDLSMKSFVGSYPIPAVYGLTCGELARMIVGEEWLPDRLNPRVSVILMEGWKRSMLWEASGLPWIPPSPNIPTAETAMIYPATCYIEQTNLSEGRGTSEPFWIVGAPFVRGEELARKLNEIRIPGIETEEVSFTPTASKYAGEECNGIRLRIVDRLSYSPIRVGVALLREFVELYPEDLIVNREGLGRLIGSEGIVDWILDGKDSTGVAGMLDDGVETFRTRSTRYRLYE